MVGYWLCTRIYTTFSCHRQSPRICLFVAQLMIFCMTFWNLCVFKNMHLQNYTIHYLCNVTILVGISAIKGEAIFAV